MGIHWQGHTHSKLTLHNHKSHTHTNTVHALVVRELIHPKQGKHTQLTTHTVHALVVCLLIYPKKGKTCTTHITHTVVPLGVSAPVRLF